MHAAPTTAAYHYTRFLPSHGEVISVMPGTRFLNFYRRANTDTYVIKDNEGHLT